ncbi:MAG: helix-turn-helix domain-containing protein [bacterium]|nr:helix-turn-helix domain-containing protein [bacterium]
MKRTVFIGIVIFIVCNFSLWSLDPSIPAKDYLVHEWRMEDGLPSDNISCMAQTPDGYLWIGTNGGLVRFDGVNFQSIDSKDEARTGEHMIMKLHVDRHGALWIASFSGLTRYKNKRFRSFFEADGLPQKPVYTILEDTRGNLMVSNRTDNIYVLQPETETFTKLMASDPFKGKSVHAYLLDSKGVLWFRVTDLGVFKFLNGTYTKADFDTPLKKRMGEILETRDGHLWMTTGKGLVCRADNTSTLFNTDNSALSQNCLRALLEDSDKNLWLGSRSGLNCMKQTATGKQAEVILDGISINGTFEDRSKNIWVATNGSGLRRLKNPLIRTYTKKDGLPNEAVHCLLEARDGTIWAGTGTHLCRYRDGVFETVPTFDNFNGFALAEGPEGQLWVGSAAGLLLNPGRNQRLFTREHGMVHNSAIHLFFDSRNRLWIGTHAGISRYENGTFTSLPTADGLPGDIGNGFYENDNHDILTSTSKGIIRFPNGQFPATPILAESNHVMLEGLTSSFILKDKHTPDVLWVGSFQDGLFRIAGGTPFSFKDANGMLTNRIYQAVEDEFGFFWFSSDKGIMKINKKELEDFADGKTDWINCIAFGTKEGMLNVECSWSSLNSIIKTRGGDYWFATKKGICVLNPSKIKIDKEPPNVILEAVEYNDKQLVDTSKENRLTQVDSIVFRFTAPSFTSPYNTRFRYRLEGRDQKWQTLAPCADREAIYKNLSPGEYRFRVTACNRDGIWSVDGISLAFEVLAPFYATLWFWGLVLLAVAACAAGTLLWFRKNYTRKQEQPTPYEGTKLDPDKSKNVEIKLKALMELKKIYRNEDLSLKELAEKLNVSVHFLSQLLNEKMGMGFFDLMNQYRVEEVKKRLGDPAESETSILAIAYDAGFSSKSSFNRYFKKFTGMTPSQFKKQTPG